MDEITESKSDEQTFVSTGQASDQLGEQTSADLRSSRRGFISGMAWALPALYLFEFGVSPALAGQHGDTHTDSHTDGHYDVQRGHIDFGHADNTAGPPQHQDVAHQDIEHQDGMVAGGHYDKAHGDTAHVDTNVWNKAHIDIAHIDQPPSHSDVPQAHLHADIHGDTHSDAPVA